jgi:hypothetical protein
MGRNRRIEITDVVEYKNKNNSRFIISLEADGLPTTYKFLAKKYNVSESLIKLRVSTAKSLRINGDLVNVTRMQKGYKRFDIVFEDGKKHYSLSLTEVKELLKDPELRLEHVAICRGWSRGPGYLIREVVSNDDHAKQLLESVIEYWGTDELEEYLEGLKDGE